MRRALALTLVFAGFFIAAACSSDSNTATSPTTSTTSTTSAGASSPSASGGGDASATVKVATDATFGEILVDSEGRTVYIFDNDMGTTTACTGACAQAWPAVVAAGTAQGGSGVTGSMLGTAQGQAPGQVTYNGHLLYRYAGDAKAGDVNGAAIPNWHPITPAGAAAN